MTRTSMCATDSCKQDGRDKEQNWGKSQSPGGRIFCDGGHWGEFSTRVEPVAAYQSQRHKPSSPGQVHPDVPGTAAAIRRRPTFRPDTRHRFGFRYGNPTPAQTTRSFRDPLGELLARTCSMQVAKAEHCHSHEPQSAKDRERAPQSRRRHVP